MNLKPMLEDIADEVAIRYVYLYLLGRPVESEDILLAQLAAGRTIDQVRKDFMDGDEFSWFNGNDKEVALKYWNIQFKRLVGSFLSSDSIDSIVMIQSCDPYRYVKLLNISSRFNCNWCLNNGIQYHSKPKLYKGKSPHYAMFNKIYMFNELLQSGYTGWAIWLDADGIVIDKRFDVRSFLHGARSDGYAFVMQHAGDVDGVEYWHNVNTGCFFADLSNPYARFVISKWVEFYDTVFPLNILDDIPWSSIMNDQYSFVSIIRSLDGFSKKILHYPTESVFTFNATRSDNLDISAEDELEDRARQLQHVGVQFYPDIIDL
jgi:hypothetical protein